MKNGIRQIDVILDMLLKAGAEGCPSEQLNQIAFRYSALIYKLRHREGWDIQTRKREGTELATFVLLGKRGDIEQMELVGV